MKLSSWISLQMVLIIPQLYFVCIAISCYTPLFSCNSPGQKLCSTGQKQMIVHRPVEIDLQQCFQDGWLLAFCSWKCNAEKCTGFNYFENAVVGDDLCHLYLEYFPEFYKFSNRCTFYKISESGDSCVPDGKIGIVANFTELSINEDYSDVPVMIINQWIVIHQRYGNTQEFNKSWSDYKKGFGTKMRNFWFGLEKIYLLVSSRSYSLKFEVTIDSGIAIIDEYSTFSLSDESKEYMINVGSYAGYNLDIMNYQATSAGPKHNGQMFSTADMDHDGNSRINCAQSASGGWWYHSQQCATTDLHGSSPASYKIKVSSSDIPVVIKSSRMLIRAN